MKNKKPCLKSGRILKSEEEIKISCKQWDSSDWEDYLKTLEINQEEILLENPVLIEEYSQEADDAYYDSVFTISSGIKKESIK